MATSVDKSNGDSSGSGKRRRGRPLRYSDPPLIAPAVEATPQTVVEATPEAGPDQGSQVATDQPIEEATVGAAEVSADETTEIGHSPSSEAGPDGPTDEATVATAEVAADEAPPASAEEVAETSADMAAEAVADPTGPWESAANGELATDGVPTASPVAELDTGPEMVAAGAVMPLAEIGLPTHQDIVEDGPPPLDEFHDVLGQAVGLRLDSVSREFGGFRETHITAVRDVSIEIGPGEFVAMMGPSGCGKSTLLALMGGLDRPTGGRVFAAGLPLGELREGDLADYRLRRVSTIFQTFNLIPSMSVEDNVALPLTLAGVPLLERRKRALHLLGLVGLEDKARTRAGRLSGGEQQKTAVARALANRPGLILADEPTGSLDSKAGTGVLSLLEDLNRRGATVVLVTHDPEVARHAHRVVRMIDGRAVELESGKPTLRSHEPVEPAPRLNWRDTLKVGLGSAGRRPLRTSLTTTGVALGIAALSLILAMAGGLQQALDAPALATSQLHQVAVFPAADQGASSFDDATLATLAARSHVRAAWGQIGMKGTFSVAGPTQPGTGKPPPAPSGVMVSLPPLGSSSAMPVLLAGRLPGSDRSTEVLLGDAEAAALGFTPVASAVGTQVTFNATTGSLSSGPGADSVTQRSALKLTVVGIVSSSQLPAGSPGAMAPYGLMRTYWADLAAPNGWKGGEYSSLTLLADSGMAVEGLRKDVENLGFHAQTFGDQFRNLEDLLAKIRVALLGLALVAILLACLGIANTMYTAVLERTKEIGVLKALGARSRDVLLLFVSEAAGIGLAGGLVGIIVAIVLGRLGNSAVDKLTQTIGGSDFQVFRADVPVVLAAIVAAVVLSTVSGLLPAVRAAREDPAQALRHE